MKISIYRTIRLLAVLLLGWAFDSRADVLDWDTQNWTDTTDPYSQTFMVSGVNVTVAITGDTSYIQSGGYGTSPNENGSQNGGSGGNALYLYVDYATTGPWWDRDYGNEKSITVTISFASPVTAASFSIFDIDYSSGGFTDQIRNVSATDSVSIYYPTISGTNSSYTTVAGSGASATVTGIQSSTDGASTGNATFTFGGNEVTSISFTYGNASSAPSNPSGQSIGLGDITYTVVPEASTMTAAFLLGLWALAEARWRRFRVRV